MSPRKPHTARPSRLSLTTRLKKLEEENTDLRDALEGIADILEDVGILEPEGEGEWDDTDPSNLIVEPEFPATDETEHKAEDPQPPEPQSS